MWNYWVKCGKIKQNAWALRSSHRKCSTKKAGLKTFAIYTRKQLCWVSLLKSDSSTGVNIVNFLRTPILKKTTNGCFWLLIDLIISLKILLNVYLRVILFKYLSTQILSKETTLIILIVWFFSKDIRTIGPLGKLLPGYGFGFCSSLGLVLGLGATRQMPPRQLG